MFWLIVHMWLLLIIAFAIGIFAGAWIYGHKKNQQIVGVEPEGAPVQKPGEIPMGSLQQDEQSTPANEGR